MEVIEYIFFFLVIILAVYIVIQKKHINALIGYGAFGTLLSGMFIFFNAPDVALVEITIGAAFIFFIYIIAIKKIAGLKIYYIETKNMFERKNNNFYGFEYSLIEMFLKENNLEAKYIKVSDKKQLEDFYKNGDILCGAIISENESSEYLVSNGYLPAKLFCFKKEKEDINGIFLSEDNLVIDYIRVRNRNLLSKNLEIIDTKNSFYKTLFNKKNKNLLKRYDLFIKELKNDNSHYEKMIRRYL